MAIKVRRLFSAENVLILKTIFREVDATFNVIMFRVIFFANNANFDLTNETINGICSKVLNRMYSTREINARLNLMNSNAVLCRYNWSPVWADNATYYYQIDGNKNVTELTDASGAVVAHYEYSPFGAVVTAIGTYAEDNPFRFSSEYYDPESSLVYYNYRYYSPTLGRWLRPDPIEEQGGLNLYVMVRNNAINSYDKEGLTYLSDTLNFRDNLRQSWQNTIRPFVKAVEFIAESFNDEDDKLPYDPKTHCCINGIIYSKNPVDTGVSLNEGFTQGLFFSGLFPAHTYIQIDDESFGLYASSHLANQSAVKTIYDTGTVQQNELTAYPPTNSESDESYTKRKPILLSPCKYDIEKFRSCIRKKMLLDAKFTKHIYMIVGWNCSDYAKQRISTCMEAAER